MIISRQVLLVIALAMLAVSLVFLTWVLQLPSYAPQAVGYVPPAVGIVSVEVVATATPSATADPAVVDFCSSYPKDLQQACVDGITAGGGRIPESSQDCELVPEELREECMRNFAG
ncbi:MAG: hypothetical protein QXR53_01170 [Candidatus Norongarragalinales archaeon]